jgi:intracellular sulfur oxidation DsrE/DsrF family protein
MSSRYGHQKVVYHVDYEGGFYDKPYFNVLNNISNNIDAVGVDNIEVSVVIHGYGVEMLEDAVRDQALQDKIRSLRELGVSFLICQRTLKGQHLELTDLYGVTQDDIVPSGVAEIGYLQQQGYTYIKP